MIKQNSSIDSVKNKVKDYLSKSVEVKVNLGRNKFVKYIGTVSGLYPALFTITPKDKFNGKTSFSYSEFMCGIVDIKEIN